MQKHRAILHRFDTQHQFCPCDISGASICKDIGRYCTVLNTQDQFCPCDISDAAICKDCFCSYQGNGLGDKDGQSGILMPFGVKKQKSTLALKKNNVNVALLYTAVKKKHTDKKVQKIVRL